MIRPLRPTDTIALVNFGRQACPNEATARDRVGKQGAQVPAWGILIREWLPWTTQRQAWVAEDGGAIAGLVSVKPGTSSTVWDVDVILLGDCNAEDVCADLLDGLSQAGSDQGIERVFLRLLSQSPLFAAARRAGFAHYLTEYLYRAEAPVPPQGAPLKFRATTGKDELPLFQLYSAAVPVSVRRMEGMTLREWQETQKGWGRGRQELVEQDEAVLAWLRVADQGKAGFFEMTVRPSEEDVWKGVIARALVQLVGKQTVTCLVPDYQDRLRWLLEQNGFQQAAQYCALGKQLTARVKQTVLVPARA
ncbi:MAG: hypothetical protein HYX92_02445 [Chloroflexi bacterium]|nr:hypothetical protein [Chloroflexota bacterium]